jgi:hypothetical protein
MKAKFSSRPQERVVYVSWIADDFGIAEFCVDRFIRELLIIDADELGIPLRKGCTPIEGSSHSLPGDLKKEDMLRDYRDRVTDFIGMITTEYIKHNKLGGTDDLATELVIFLERKQADKSGTLTMWLAPLEAMKLSMYVIAGICLGDPTTTWLHRLKGDNEGWKFPMKDDLKSIGEFRKDIRWAVYRVKEHIRDRCPACGGQISEELVSQPAAAHSLFGWLRKRSRA